jgi:hypothetical protein
MLPPDSGLSTPGRREDTRKQMACQEKSNIDILVTMAGYNGFDIKNGKEYIRVLKELVLILREPKLRLPDEDERRDAHAIFSVQGFSGA